MSLTCCTCGSYGPFSNNQKRKRAAGRRCYDCSSGGYDTSFTCDKCGKPFRDQNALVQHERTHRPRNFPCPGCGNMYRGMTDTAAHFESGACAACEGQDNARRAAYRIVSNQQGGGSFLIAPLLLTHDGGQGGGYTGTNDYHCPGCQKPFSLLTSLLQHTENSPECSQRGQHVNLRLGHSGGQPQRMKFCHGTTWQNALSIERAGFIPSEIGCLGRGIYVAHEDKARKFAELHARETGADRVGLVHLIVTVANPKYVLKNDYYWQSEGYNGLPYDACRAERTTVSTNMEWCIRDAHQVEVTRVEEVWVY